MAKGNKSATTAQRATTPPEPQKPADALAAFISAKIEKRTYDEEFASRIGPYRKRYDADVASLHAALDKLFADQIEASHSAKYNLKLWANQIVKAGQLVAKYCVWRAIVAEHRTDPAFLLIQSAADSAKKTQIAESLHQLRDSGALADLTWQYVLNSLGNDVVLHRDRQEQLDNTGLFPPAPETKQMSATPMEDLSPWVRFQAWKKVFGVEDTATRQYLRDRNAEKCGHCYCVSLRSLTTQQRARLDEVVAQENERALRKRPRRRKSLT